MSEFETPWEQFLTDAQSWLMGVYIQWDALSSDRRLAIVFAAICLCSFLLVFVYRRKLHKTKDTVIRLEASNRVARQCIESYEIITTRGMNETSNPPGPGSGEPEEYDTIEVEGGLHEEFVLEILGQMRSMHDNSLRTMKSMAEDFSRSNETSTKGITNALGDQFVEVLEKLTCQQANANQLMIDTVSHITNVQQSAHGDDTKTMQRLAKCIERVYEDDPDDDEDDEE